MQPLDEKRIVAVAWELVDSKGLSAFTIRALAAQLGVTPMAIYHHVRNKAALATLMVERANAEHPLAPFSGSWQEDLWLMANWLRETRLAHPALPELRRQYRVWTPALLQIAERWVAIWRQSDLPIDKYLIGARASSVAIVGMVDEEWVYAGEDLPADDLLMEMPTIQPMFRSDQRREELFELSVRSLIEGLYRKLACSDAI